MTEWLTRYWFSFDRLSGPNRLRLGCGVTAVNYEDALALLSQRLSKPSLETIVQCTENIDVSTLDPRHILPNIGDVTVRGIWFPRGF
jgi:hypothetical protein